MRPKATPAARSALDDFNYVAGTDGDALGRRVGGSLLLPACAVSRRFGDDFEVVDENTHGVRAKTNQRGWRERSVRPQLRRASGL